MRRSEERQHGLGVRDAEQLQVVFLFGLILRNKLGCRFAFSFEQLLAHVNLHLVEALYRIGLHFACHHLFDHSQILALQFQTSAYRIHTRGL